MKHLLPLLFIILIGDCVQIQKGVFAGEYWRVIKRNLDRTYDLRQNNFTLTNVKESYLNVVHMDYCRER